jgi:mono/diheme cytochrome c family protein
MRPALFIAMLATAACAGVGRGGTGSSQGERLYRAKCASCHRLRQPDEHTIEGWERGLAKHGPQAHLTDDEREAIRGFLLANAADAPQQAPISAP